MNRLRLRLAQKSSIAQRHQGLLSLLLKEVQETLKDLRIRLVQPRRSTGEFLVIGRRLGHRGAGRVVETAEGEEEGSQQHSRHISIARTRGQERSSVFLAFSEQNALPSTSERITLTLNDLTSIIDCVLHPNRQQNAPSAAVFAVKGNLQNQAYLHSGPSDQYNPIRHIFKRGAESSFPGFSPTRRLGTVVFLRFKDDRSSHTVKFRK